MLQLTALFRQEVSRPAESSHLDLPPRPTKQPKTLQNLADIPADQTLKTCLRFSSSRPFDCCQDATLANSSSGIFLSSSQPCLLPCISQRAYILFNERDLAALQMQPSFAKRPSKIQTCCVHSTVSAPPLFLHAVSSQCAKLYTLLHYGLLWNLSTCLKTRMSDLRLTEI